MKIDKVWINDFKNLKDIKVDFSENNFVNVILGWNGTGKSNLLEALVLIFRNIDLNKKSDFDFEIDYFCNGKKVRIRGNKELQGTKSYNFFELQKENSLSLSLSQFKDQELLPEYVFGYYSGPSDRLSSHFQEHQKRFYDALLRGDEKALRPFFYARPIHSQFVLLSFFITNDAKVNKFLKDTMGIEGLDSVLFVLNKPNWNSSGGDERFWNSRGVVQKFLSHLMTVSIAPLKLSRRDKVDFRKSEMKEFLYLYVKDIDSLQQLKELAVKGTKDKGEASRDFFKLLESTYISELLDEVRIRVKIKNSDQSLTFRELSEGEQQLLTVLGLLRFTGNKNSLFLLDEPDTHINPSWSIDYIEHLKSIGGLEEFLETEKNKKQKRSQSQIIMATHNPLVIANLKKEQVHILNRDNDRQKISVSIPETDPRGLGVSGILTSDMFGLRSELDVSTQSLINEQARLITKDKLTVKDKQRLEKLNTEMNLLGFMSTHSNPLYEKFLKAYMKLQGETETSMRVISKSEQVESLNVAKRIVSTLKKSTKKKTAKKNTSKKKVK
ncbi:hypothetical protein C0V70_04240 [Bacteriovorax stolpii]|uniref:ATPase AAA-type core domain-containing protein n=1 Tax=Bacteriovorax stolpii TaxID=960 RepID=A0A2K9NPA7_BACTC|nr:ATP-binding protein [Bacteriovorax stolpii]AUN97332.1 hypothetical protein C0V70_04240 [Bacteriovorax stolpii]TDP52504.1 putative AbiEii toxin of type IV toxin-antitoxin system [Bacteriovorax stolpii]